MWIDAGPDQRPVAYVSMATRQVFVDRAYRDRASWLLDAHISVSTALWRIRLPGDSPLTPIPPGDEAREFEERPIGDWDPAVGPEEGDIRIVLGRQTDVVVTLACAPVQGTTDRLTAGELHFARSLGGGEEPVREDFLELGRGRRHRDRDCEDVAVEVPIVGWGCRP